MSRNLPRRPASSRAPVARPRRVAGQTTTAPPPTPAPVESSLKAPPVVGDGEAAAVPDAPFVADEPTVVADRPAVAVDEPAVTVDEPAAKRHGLGALFESRRATRVLVGIVVVLAVAAGGLFAWDDARGTESAKPSSQPVVISGDDATAGVDAAAKAAETIVATSYQDYDKQVDEATALMTDAFAAKYRQTAADIEPDFVAAKTEIQARVVAQGIVHATRTEVQALVFLNQYVSKDGGDTTYTPYRALVTVVHTDRGWLVSDLDTK